jgi:hypothetical protein
MVQTPKNIMNAKVALNLKAMKPRDQLAKIQTAITKCSAAPALANPIPPLVDCQAAHDAALAVIVSIETSEKALDNLRIQRDATMQTVIGKYTTLGASVESASLGDPAFITAKGFDVAGAPGSTPHVQQVLSLTLTHGDLDGSVDVSWHRDKSAKIYEVQTSPEPMSDKTWVPNQMAPKSSCTIAGQTAGTRLWVRVRAIGKDGPGLWSEPANIIVS